MGHFGDPLVQTKMPSTKNCISNLWNIHCIFGAGRNWKRVLCLCGVCFIGRAGKLCRLFSPHCIPKGVASLFFCFCGFTHKIAAKMFDGQQPWCLWMWFGSCFSVYLALLGWGMHLNLKSVVFPSRHRDEIGLNLLLLRANVAGSSGKDLPGP